MQQEYLLGPRVYGRCQLGVRKLEALYRIHIDELPPDLHSAPQQWAAQSFVMPAMSPTMTEGNIASWKVKEGKDTVTINTEISKS